MSVTLLPQLKKLIESYKMLISMMGARYTEMLNLSSQIFWTKNI